MQRVGWMSIGPRVPGSRTVNVVVETPAGSRSKFRFDEHRGVFLLHKLLPLGAAFPFDFGFIPGTRGEDGDAVDLILLGEEATFTGCLVTARVLGIIEAEQTEKNKTIRNDRLVGTAETDKIRPRTRSMNDLAPGVLDQIEHFFVAYNRAEGREFVILGRRGPQVAWKRIEEGIRNYRASSKRSGRS